MINFIAMAAILAAFFLSRSGRTVPAVMLAYYAATIGSMRLILGTFDPLTPVVLSQERADLWYVTSISVDIIFIVAMLLVCSFERLSGFYRAVIFYIVLTKVFAIPYGSIDNEWFVTTYQFLQYPVVLLEVSIAWLASDNFVSRKLYRLWDLACHHLTRKTDL